MHIYFVNTDARASLDGTSLHADWLARGLIVTSGPSKYRDKLSKIERGDLVLPYVNGQGVVAVGRAVDGEIVDVTDRDLMVNRLEEYEYHMQVTWLHDLRANPIPASELVSFMNNTPRHAVQRMQTGEAKLLNHLRSLPSIPTADPEDCRRRAAALLRLGPVERPTGTVNPGRTAGDGSGYFRDPKVRAWTAQRAGGMCEQCDDKARFVDDYDQPYLESHHIHHLAKGGADTPENTAAICANCHRELHYGAMRLTKSEKLRLIVLSKEAEHLK